MVATRWFGRAGGIPWRCNVERQRFSDARSQSRPTSVFESRQSRITLVELRERHLHDLDALVLVGLGALVVEVRGDEEVALLVGEARARCRSS